MIGLGIVRVACSTDLPFALALRDVAVSGPLGVIKPSC